MKKLLLLILFLILCSSPFVLADGWFFSGGGAYDYCTPLGTNEQYWDGDHGSGTNHACESGGTEAGTLSGATISTDQNHTTGGGSYSYALDCTAVNQYLEFNVDAKITSSEGEIDIWFYPAAVDTTYTLFEYYKDANDYIYIYVESGSNKTVIVHDGGGTYHSSYSAGTINATAWNHVQARWYVTGSDLDMQLNGEGWQEDADAIVAFDSGEPTTFCYGEKDTGSAQGNTIYIDDAVIEATSSSH